MPGAVDVLLQHCSYSCVRGISCEAGGGIGRGVVEKAGICECIFRGSEGSNCVISPGEGLGLRLAGGKERVEGLHEVCTVREEPVVKVH